jgi:hypothetical protein
MISQKNYELWAEYDDRIENPSTRDALNILRGAAAASIAFRFTQISRVFCPMSDSIRQMSFPMQSGSTIVSI